MTSSDEFWQLQHLSNTQLLEQLGQVLSTKRRALAELIAHLGEVEARRLHLEAAHPSLFDYCTVRLEMSEDEACRRIELARLARRFPALFPLLASGEISMSVVLLFKPVLTQENHVELLAAARGLSLRQARELLAAHFPRPDVPASIRKLPERRVEMSASPSEPEGGAPQPTLLPMGSGRGNAATSVETKVHQPPAPAMPSSRIEPLSPQRYKIQFTADAALKQKLEQARDLLRHAHPSGDLAEILSRALDLLIAEQLKRRFGAGTRPRVSHAQSSATGTPAGVPRASRRAVLQRDGLRCTWVSAEGVRCKSSAWLQLDHRHPRGKGGGSEPANLRILCRAHNHFAAERAYGREHVERARATRQQAAPATPPL